jgi:hypothetical protein
MIWIIILGAFLLIFTFILFAPLQLKIDSKLGVYHIDWGGIIEGNFIPDHDNLLQSKLKLRILFWSRSIKPFLHRGKSVKKKRSKKDISEASKKKKWKIPFKHPIRKIRAILNSFQIKDFEMNVDTDDYVMNAYLYPVFHLFSSKYRHLKINYEGKLELRFWVKNSGARLLYAFIK